MNGFLAIERSDGGVSVEVGVPADADMAARVARWEQQVAARGWTAVSHFWSAADPRPADRTLRNALKRSGRTLVEDVATARALAQGRGVAIAAGDDLAAIREKLRR
jgi:hypothetical protein